MKLSYTLFCFTHVLENFIDNLTNSNNYREKFLFVRTLPNQFHQTQTFLTPYFQNIVSFNTLLLP